MSPLAPARFYLTGRYRLRPDGERVVLQLHESTRPMQAPQDRWRDATPQDVMALVSVQIEPAVMRVKAGAS